jgi:drug/metabolite transporter (DMT)-like permease
MSDPSVPLGAPNAVAVAPAARDIRRLPLVRGDDPLRGILLVIAATVLFSVSDATAKYVSQTLPVIEVAWFRYAVFVALTLPPALRHRRAALDTRRPATQVVRGLAVVLSAILFVYGLRVLPMADAAAINFVAPLFITMLSVPMLGEQVGLRRWSAVAVGLLGATIAAQPGTAAFSAGAIFPVLSAAAWALGMVLTRRMAGTEQPATTLVWTAGTGLALLTCLLPLQARLPSFEELALCLLIGLVASGGQWLVVLAYRCAPASLLAPFAYLQLIWSSALGYVVFNGRPGAATVVGAAIIAASGLYSAHRERVRAAGH